MKKLLLLLLVFGFFTQLNAYDKKSLVERFTNSSCGPCATINNSWYNETTANMLNSGTISHLVYNGWWPSASDPMYLLNQSDNTSRINYYGVNSVPWIEVNGSTVSTSSGAFQNAVTNGNTEYAPFNIFISQEAVSDNLIEVKVKIVRDSGDNTTFGNIKLRVAITEKVVEYNGGNGETHFYSISRTMLPDAVGSSFTIPAAGDSTEITLQYVPTIEFLAAVNLDSLRAVAFIQDDNTQEVYQSEMEDLFRMNIPSIPPTSPDIILDSNTPAQFTLEVKNEGFLDDSYYVDVSSVATTGWTGEYTTENGTFPFGHQDLISVAVGESAAVMVTVNPNGISGYAETQVQFTSTNEPTVITSAYLRNVTNSGVEILVVDASTEGYSSLVSNSLDSVYSGSHGMVARNALDATVDLSHFQVITWSAGIGLPVFYQDDVTALQSFLDGDGRLFISGQNIGADIFETSGQSQFAQDFYNNYLHANYENDFGGSFFIQGFDGDPITDGMQFVLNDVYDMSPDEISAFDANATPILKFPAGAISSIRAASDESKVVYLGIGFEQIGDAATRDTLLERTIAWLKEGLVVGVNEDEVVVQTFNLEQNYPNPFNPGTIINYQIPESEFVSLKVYDIMGQVVAELINEKQNAGTYNVEFDASSLSSGLYVYTLTAGKFTISKKMLLMK